jgi:hypothetical protein
MFQNDLKGRVFKTRRPGLITRGLQPPGNRMRSEIGLTLDLTVEERPFTTASGGEKNGVLTVPMLAS